MVPAKSSARLASLALLALSLVALLPDCASACMCAIEDSPEERAKEAIADSDAVFSGEVVKLDKQPPDTDIVEGTMLTVTGGGGRKATVTLRVSEVWKGPKQRTVRFTTPVADGISCAHPFKEEREYLVYANGEQDLRVGGCSETKMLSGADANLALLGNSSERPKDGGALSDTSGGVSVGAMVALASLAVTGSLALAMRLLRAG
jgi:hypothetical protein